MTSDYLKVRYGVPPTKILVVKGVELYLNHLKTNWNYPRKMNKLVLMLRQRCLCTVLQRCTKVCKRHCLSFLAIPLKDSESLQHPVCLRQRTQNRNSCCVWALAPWGWPRHETLCRRPLNVLPLHTCPATWTHCMRYPWSQSPGWNWCKWCIFLLSNTPPSV